MPQYLFAALCAMGFRTYRTQVTRAFPDGRTFMGYTTYYDTRRDAEAGHRRIVTWLLATKKDKET
jgi:hypothetical protein